MGKALKAVNKLRKDMAESIAITDEHFNHNGETRRGGKDWVEELEGGVKKLEETNGESPNERKQCRMAWDGGSNTCEARTEGKGGERRGKEERRRKRKRKRRKEKREGKGRERRGKG